MAIGHIWENGPVENQGASAGSEDHQSRWPGMDLFMNGAESANVSISAQKGPATDTLYRPSAPSSL